MVNDEQTRFYTNIFSNLNLPSINITLIDNDEFDINYLFDLFNSVGIKLYIYNDMSKYKEVNNNIIIVKCSLSSQLAEFIKQMKTNSNSIISIISIIDKHDVESKVIGYQIGVDYFIEKPFEPENILLQISNVLKSQSEFENFILKRENFVASITHDLKTPINAEINALKLLTENKFGEMNAIQKSVVNSILNSAKYMKLITDQILTFYKYRNNGIILNKEKAILSDVIISAIDFIEFLIHEKQQNLIIHNNIETIVANIDILEIKRLIINLLSNAIEYSPEKSKIELFMNYNNNLFEIIVKDYGYGINLSKNNDIFEEYVSLAKRQKRVGFGLGLNICKKIVEAHNGKISIDSVIKCGTTIRFTLPSKVIKDDKK